MKKNVFLLFIISLLSISIVGCGKKNPNNIQEETGKVTEEIEQVEYAIETDNVSVVDYTKLDFEKTETEIPEEDVEKYIKYLLENYAKETGNELDAEAELTEEIVEWLTSGNVNSVEEFQNTIKETLKEYYDGQNYYSDLEKIYELLMNESELKKYEDEELTNYKNFEIDYIKKIAENESIEIDTYIKEHLKLETEEEYNLFIKEAALSAIKGDEILNAIAEKENIQIQEEELNNQIKLMMEYYQIETEEEFYKIYNKDQILNDMLCDKVLDFIYRLYDSK